MHFVACPKQGLKMEVVVLHRVGFLQYFCPKQGQDFKPSVAPLYPNIGQVPHSNLWIVLPARVFSIKKMMTKNCLDAANSYAGTTFSYMSNTPNP